MKLSPLFRPRGSWLPLLPALALWALHPNAAWAQTAAARTGTPSVLSAVDLTLRVWSAQFQKLGIYALIGVALLAAYLTGLIVFQILFAAGTFAPRAGSVGAWFGALVLLFFGLMMMPLKYRLRRQMSPSRFSRRTIARAMCATKSKRI